MANNQARTCELKCKYNVQGICHAYGECIAKDLFIAELEKIKAEIEHLKPNNPNFAHYVGETRVINNALEVIDKHISELKGENNE